MTLPQNSDSFSGLVFKLKIKKERWKWWGQGKNWLGRLTVWPWWWTAPHLSLVRNRTVPGSQARKAQRELLFLVIIPPKWAPCLEAAPENVTKTPVLTLISSGEQLWNWISRLSRCKWLLSIFKSTHLLMTSGGNRGHWGWISGLS